MPRGNGTGPSGGGGGGGGRGAGRQRRFGRGGPSAVGPGGVCRCPACGYTQPHAAAQPCSQMSCPKCGVRMVRE